MSRWRRALAALLGPAQPVPAPAPERSLPNADATRLSDDDFIRIWKDTAAEDEHQLAVLQLVARETIAAIDLATTPALADRPGALAHAAGAAAALIELQATLKRARIQPEDWTARRPGTSHRGR